MYRGGYYTLPCIFFRSSVPSYSFSVMKQIDIPYIQFGENYLMERKVSDCRVLIGWMPDPICEKMWQGMEGDKSFVRRTRSRGWELLEWEMGGSQSFVRRMRRGRWMMFCLGMGGDGSFVRRTLSRGWELLEWRMGGNGSFVRRMRRGRWMMFCSGIGGF